MTGTSSRRRAGLATIVAALVLTALMPATAAAATRPITFDLSLGLPCIWGRASDNATVNFTWRDANGALILGGQATAGPTGYFFTECAPGGRGFRPGDRLRASDGNSVRKFTVPELTMRLNRVTNVIRGRGPAGTIVEVEYLYPAVPVPDIVGQSKRIRVRSDGTWRLYRRYPLYIIGGSGASLYWQSPAGDAVSLGARAPMIVVTIGRAPFSGIGAINSQATVTVRDGVTGAIKGTGVTMADTYGDYSGLIRTPARARLRIAAGDRVVSNVASDADFIVPDIEATGDASTEVVTGNCNDTAPSERYGEVMVYRNGFRRGWAAFHTEEDSSFWVDMTDTFPNSGVLKPGDDLLVRCMQFNGDFVQRWFVV